jgi:DNA-directed RNA polymerase subunit N (RpoN/RPB10)
MDFPVRCFSCGKVIGSMWDTYAANVNNGNEREVLDNMNIKRTCCRRMFLSHLSLEKQLLLYAD